MSTEKKERTAASSGKPIILRGRWSFLDKCGKIQAAKGDRVRITTRGRYALRASVALARLQDQGTPVSINHLAAVEEISSVFLEQIFFRLRKAGIVSSVRGPGGGFCFAKPLESLTVKDILVAAGEELALTACDKRPLKNCRHIVTCSSHTVWEEVTSMINNYFEHLTLAAVINREAADLDKIDGREFAGKVPSGETA
ncbi:MAG: Rrf2 family transcriptional regulator [Treponema sp.]|nr:Rrf2 family transcriptional regulator [Treponema sp.]